jgi:hypothetical protein
MRHYDVAIASLAIGAPTKWTDNLLSHHSIPSVAANRRGVARRISHEGMILLALIRELHVSLDMSVRASVSAAHSMLAPSAGGVLQSGQLRVIVDRSALERALERRLRDALESAPVRRRGRPPVPRGRDGVRRAPE